MSCYFDNAAKMPGARQFFNCYMLNDLSNLAHYRQVHGAGSNTIDSDRVLLGFNWLGQGLLKWYQVIAMSDLKLTATVIYKTSSKGQLVFTTSAAADYIWWVFGSWGPTIATTIPTNPARYYIRTVLERNGLDEAVIQIPVNITQKSIVKLNQPPWLVWWLSKFTRKLGLSIIIGNSKLSKKSVRSVH